MMTNLILVRLLRQFLFLGMIVLLGASCTRYFYSPADMQLMPIAGKGNGAAGIQLQSVAESVGGGINAVYSPVRGLALKSQLTMQQGKGNFYSSGSGFFPGTDYTAKGRGMVGELSAGLYSTKWKRFWVAGFAGGGINRITYWYNDSKKSSLNYARAFVQPELIHTGRYADIGFGLRTSYVQYYGGSIDASIPRDDLEIIRMIDSEGNFVLHEFNFMLGARVKQFYLRNSFTWLISDASILSPSRLQSTTALVYTFGPKRKPKPSKK